MHVWETQYGIGSVWETQYGIESVKSKRLLLSRLHSALNLPVLSTSFRQKKQQNSNNNNKNWKKVQQHQ